MADYIKVMVVDDQQMVRSGLTNLLELDPAIKVIGEAESGWEALMEGEKLKPDVILMDIQMAAMSGLEATARLKAVLPTTQVLIITNYKRDNYLLEAVRAGSSGYLLKDCSGEVLCESVREAYSGQFLIESAVLREALAVRGGTRAVQIKEAGPKDGLSKSGKPKSSNLWLRDLLIKLLPCNLQFPKRRLKNMCIQS